jgi:signal transduction histidine kinase
LRRHLTYSPVSPSSPEEPDRRERSLAIARLFLAVSVFIAAFFAPGGREWPMLRPLFLLGYVLFASAVLIVLRARRRRAGMAAMVHGVDVLAAAGVTALTGPGSPFLLAVLFPLMAAAHRWGFRATMATTAAVVGLLAMHAMLAMGAGPLIAAAPLEFDRWRLLGLRSALVLITGVLLGYVTQTENRMRVEEASIAAIVSRVELRLGLSKAMALVCDAVVRLFDANRAILVIHEAATNRVWSWEGARLIAGSSAPLRVSALDPGSRDTYLFGPASTAWHAVRRPDDGLDVVALDPHGSRSRQAPPAIPEPFFAAIGPFHQLMAIGIEIPGELTGRFFLLDSRWDGDRESGLAFAQRIVRQVYPAIYNLYLLHRLRSRSAAIERARIGRELHDGIIQSVLGVQIQLHALSVPAATTSRALASELNRLGTILRDEVVGLRDLIQRMKPIDVTADQLMNTIADIVQRFERETGITARFITPFDRIDLPTRACGEVARVVQEALVNVRKHSGARNVVVRLAVSEGVCRLAIDDDGRGFPFAGRLSAVDQEQTHQGPVVIKERVRLLGGELTVESDPGRGARLEISFPVATHAIHG